MVSDRPPSTDGRTRREVLRESAGLAAAGLTTLGAGCASALPPLGSEQRFGRVDAPPADPPRYRRWLPAPAEVGADDSHYAFLFRRPTGFDYPAPVRFTTPRKRLLADLDHFGIGYQNYDALVATAFGTVVEADVRGDAVADALAESGYRADGTYEGYDRFTRSDVPRRALVTDGAVVWASQRVHDRPNVEAFVDAHDGRIDRYHEANAGFERLSDVVGESRMVEFVPPTTDRTWTKCEGFRFDGTTAYHLMTFLYPEGEVPPEAELRRRSKRGTVLTREVENADFGVDGRLVTVAGRVPPNAGVAPSEIEPPYPPQVTWGVDRGDGTVTVRHEAGAAVATDVLAFEFGVDAAPDQLTLAETRPLPTDVDEFGPGDSATIDVGDDPTVAVIDVDDVDHDAEDPYAARTRRRATHLGITFGPGDVSRRLFRFELEGAT
jgi:hypothetical protein